MPEPTQPTVASSPNATSGGLFQEPPKAERSFPAAAVGIAAVAVLVVLALLLILGRKHGTNLPANTLQPTAAEGFKIQFSGIELSESTSYSGGKSTFVDGRVTNTSSATVTGVRLQLLFAPEGGGAPQLESAPLTLVRTRQPYVDIEPVSAAPLAPGASADFRLIFEDIRPEWNQQSPEIHVVGVTER